MCTNDVQTNQNEHIHVLIIWGVNFTMLELNAEYVSEVNAIKNQSTSLHCTSLCNSVYVKYNTHRVLIKHTRNDLHQKAKSSARIGSTFPVILNGRAKYMIDRWNVVI